MTVSFTYCSTRVVVHTVQVDCSSPSPFCSVLLNGYNISSNLTSVNDTYSYSDSSGGVEVIRETNITVSKFTHINSCIHFYNLGVVQTKIFMCGVCAIIIITHKIIFGQHY